MRPGGLSLIFRLPSSSGVICDEFPVWRQVWSEPETRMRDPYFDAKRVQVRGRKGSACPPAISGDFRLSSENGYTPPLEEDVSVRDAFRFIQSEIEELGL